MVTTTADQLRQYLDILSTQQLTNYNNILLIIEPEFIKNKKQLNPFSHACKFKRGGSATPTFHKVQLLLSIR